MTLLEVTDLCTDFQTSSGVLRAVENVSVDLRSGKTLGVVGESGSGKSVLARSIMGLASRHGAHVNGSVKFEGNELIGARPKQLRRLWGREIGMVFQDPMRSLNPVMRIGRQVGEGLRAHLNLSRADALQRTVELLEAVGIPSPDTRVRQFPHELSGGMRQRVAIAVALACGPKLLLADEPTTALDVTVQAQILSLLGDLQRDRQMAMVLVTHDLGVVATRTDEICVMYAGRIVERAATQTLFRDVKMPYTQALFDSIPRLDNASHTRLVAIGGRPPDMLHPPSGCKFAPRCRFVQEKCLLQEPPLVEASPGHEYRCWFPLTHGAALSDSGHRAGGAD